MGSKFPFNPNNSVVILCYLYGGFCVCTCMPCSPGPQVLHGTGFAVAMHFGSPRSCRRFMALLGHSLPPALTFWMVPHSFKVTGEVSLDSSSHWDRRPGHCRSSWRAVQFVRGEPARGHKPRTVVQPLRDNQQPACHCTNKAVFLGAACGIGCFVHVAVMLFEDFLRLFQILLEANVGTVFLLFDGEACLERGPAISAGRLGPKAFSHIMSPSERNEGSKIYGSNLLEVFSCRFGKNRNI